MRQKASANQKPSAPKNNKYDDWTCLFCQNHNYSFRLICNRCHIQTKQQNAYMSQIYQHHLQIAQEIQYQAYVNTSHQQFQLDSFPNVLLLMINDDPWQQYPLWRQSPETLNIKWINNLIQE